MHSRSSKQSFGDIVSVFNQKLGTVEATAANAAVSPPHFAVPATLPEPGSSADNGRSLKHRTITDREFALVQVCTDFLCACAALPVSLVVLAVASSAHINSMHLLGQNLATDCLFPVAVIVALAL